MHYGMIQRDNNVMTFDDIELTRQLRLTTSKSEAKKLLLLQARVIRQYHRDITLKKP